MSIYKNFRNFGARQADYNTLSKRFDQPTYMTFRLEFASNADRWYNGASGEGLNYDRMPHPLFGSRGNADVLQRETYSAVDYLFDANEFTRAKMLEEFIIKFNTLQNNYQYYFQELTGVEELLKIDHKKGMRIPSDKRLTVKMLEGIDLRISHLMNMYRKIVWDDTYQRWVLPDMMRYFTLKIYVTEFRTFHGSNQFDGMGIAKAVKEQEKRMSLTGLRTTFQPAQNPIEGELFLSILDDVFPSWVINCEMCEFDIENTSFSYLPTLSTNAEPTEAAVTMSIKVGKIYEEQVYPIFKNAYLIDRVLNGFDRSKPSDIDTDRTNVLAAQGISLGSGLAITKEFDSTEEGRNNKAKYGYNYKIGEDTASQSPTHEVGKPFNQAVELPQFDLGAQKVNPTEPNTWVGNAITFGKSFVTNFVKEKIDKAKITPIPGLGFSIKEAVAAIQSKDIITALGLIRKSVNRVTEFESGYPSDHLGGKQDLEITDAAFRAFLVGVTQSKATSELQLQMQAAAGVALSDAGVWQKIKDFSRSTNLTGAGETNVSQSIKDKFGYMNIAEEQSNLEPIPLSDAKLAGLYDGKMEKINDLSKATSLTGKGETNLIQEVEGKDFYKAEVNLQSVVTPLKPQPISYPDTKTVLNPQTLTYNETAPVLNLQPISYPDNKIVLNPQPIPHNEVAPKLIPQPIHYDETAPMLYPQPIAYDDSKTVLSMQPIPQNEVAPKLNPQPISYKQETTKLNPQPIIYEGIPTSAATSNTIIKG